MKKGDAIVLALVLAAAGLSFLLLWLLGEKDSENLVAQVYVEGVLVKSVPLPASGEEEILIQGIGGYNRVLVTPHSAFIVESDCPSQDCVRAAALTAPGQANACLPHRLLLRLSGGAVRGEVDSIAQ